MFVDGIQALGVHNGVARLLMMRLVSHGLHVAVISLDGIGDRTRACLHLAEQRKTAGRNEAGNIFGVFKRDHSLGRNRFALIVVGDGPFVTARIQPWNIRAQAKTRIAA